MATVVFNDISYSCATALKGNDYIHLLDSNGVMIAAFDGVVDFSGFTISDGNWTTPTAEGDCYLAVVKDDGTIGKGTHKCCDIPSAPAAVSVSILTSQWSSKTATVYVSGVTTASNLIVTPAPESYVTWCECQVRATAQAANSITFQCEEVPSNHLTANILIVG